MDRVVYVVSDLHLGPGWLPSGELDPLEDFTADEAFAAFLGRIGPIEAPVELVIAGDFLEYCQTLPEIGLRSPEDDLGSSEEESLERTSVILGLRPEVASGHPLVFAALREFMVRGNAVTIIAGNHDIDLLWKRVWALVWDTIYPPGAEGDLRLIPFAYELGAGERGRVHIQHGHEHDKANRFGDQMQQPFGMDRKGRRRLKRCWGTLFVDKVYNQLEQERWFIDNVKPIPRVVKLGLRNDFGFTATALALVARFLLTSGLPPLLGGALGDTEVEPPPAEHVVGGLADEDLRGYLQAHLRDPGFRDEFEAALRTGDPVALLAGAGGAGAQQTLDGVDVVTGGEVVLGGGFGADDAFRSAAREVLENDPTLATVVMGHTHGPIDGYTSPIDRADGSQAYYFNSGTWTQHLKDEGGRAYSWDEIADPGNYTSSFTYVRLDPDGRGGYRPALGNWAFEG